MAAKRKTTKRSTAKLASRSSKRWQRFGIFAIVFAVSGGLFLLFRAEAAITYLPTSNHKSTCVLNSPSKTVVRPGETFTAVVKMRNNGPSTWNSSYGVFLGELRDGAAIWSASGNTTNGSVTPGQTKTFNLTVRAPRTPGRYSFNWGMVIALQGFMRDPCTGRTVTVMNPPSVSLTANNQNQDITVDHGAGLTLRWSSNNSPTSCTASGSWGGGKSASGSENRSGDTRASGTKTYVLTCRNAVGSGSATRRVVVRSPKPAPSRPSGGSGSTSSPRPSSGQSSQQPTSPTDAAPDKTAPSAPGDFSARVTSESTVSLSWSASNDNVGVKGYELQRSTDQKTWENVSGDMISDQAFIDEAVGFATTYYYRVRAIDQSNNPSKYSAVEVTTNPFESNASESSETTVTSEDGIIMASIPQGALGEDSFCTIINNTSVSSPSVEGFETFAGPYELMCKDSDGNIVEAFDKPVNIVLTLSEDHKNRYSVLSFYGHNGEDWSEIGNSQIDPLNGFSITDTNTFALLGDAHPRPLWQTVLIWIISIIGIVGGLLVTLVLLSRLKRNRALKQKMDDYYHKEHGY